MITARFRKPIKVNDLIAASGMSRRKFFKSFARQIGVSPREHLQNVRISKAKKLLAQSRQPMHRIAKLCGYKNLNTFQIAFKRATGVSPGSYRPEGKTYSIREAAETLGLNYFAIYRLIRHGKLETCNARKRILIPQSGLFQFIRTE